MSDNLTLSVVERKIPAREASPPVPPPARGDEGEMVAILSFADVERQVSLPIPAGHWVRRLDAGEARFLGDGESVAVELRSNGVVELTLAVHAVMLLEQHSAQSAQDI